MLHCGGPTCTIGPKITKGIIMAKDVRPRIRKDQIMPLRVYAAHYCNGSFVDSVAENIDKGLRCPNLTPDQVAELTGEANKAASDE
jgi:hypothetical protein